MDNCRMHSLSACGNLVGGGPIRRDKNHLKGIGGGDAMIMIPPITCLTFAVG